VLTEAEEAFGALRQAGALRMGGLRPEVAPKVGGRTSIMTKYLLAGVLFSGFAAISPAHALTMYECAVKYKAALVAGTTNNMKWNDYRKAQCGPDATIAITPAPAPPAPSAPAAAAVHPAPSESQKRAASRKPIRPVTFASTDDLLSVKNLKKALACADVFSPQTVLTQLQRDGVIAPTPITQDDGIPIFATTKPLVIAGLNVKFVGGWDESGTLFDRVPGTKPPIHVAIFVDEDDAVVQERFPRRQFHIANWSDTFRYNSDELIPHDNGQRYKTVTCTIPWSTPPKWFLTSRRLPALVPLQKLGGTFVVPVLINKVLTLNFVIDSGASDVSIPADVVSTLIRAGTISRDDFIGTQNYKLADGTIIPAATFHIHSLKIGSIELEYVVGSVSKSEGSLLLGQSFLERFKHWSIDNEHQSLLLE
jgi:clan AA aspartic protease (TIGR02281 family)